MNADIRRAAKRKGVMDVGKRLRLYRIYRDMTQKDVVAASGITTIDRIETNKVDVRLSQVIKLCEVYKIHPSDLFAKELKFDGNIRF